MKPAIKHYYYRAIESDAPEPPDYSNTIPVILSVGQSNEAAQAESSRLALTEYPHQPDRVLYYWKPTSQISASDDGNWEPAYAGVNTKQQGVGNAFGGHLILATKLSVLLNSNVYVMDVARGSTKLIQNAEGNPDWSPASSGEMFTAATEYYFDVAVPKIQALEPGKDLLFIKSITLGESEALDGQTSGYLTRLNAFDVALSAHDPLLADAPWLMHTLNHEQSANEAIINQAYADFVAANPTRAYLIDMIGQKRKVDLTVGEKGGFATTVNGGDDNHMSYLGMVYKGVQGFNIIKTHFNMTGDDSEFTDNTTFDPTTIGTVDLRIKCARSSTTIGSSNIISALHSDWALDTAGGATPRFVINRRRGTVSSSTVHGHSRLVRNAAIGSTWFSHTFSFGIYVKPIDRTPANAMCFIDDVRSTGSPNLSRFSVQMLTTGRVRVNYAVSSAVTVDTTNPVFADADLTGKFVAVILTSGGSIVLKTCDPITLTVTNHPFGTSSSIAGLTMANYVNATLAPVIGSLRSGASYTNNFLGMWKEAIIQPVAWTDTQIQDLTRNCTY
jgi:hypothetical protein